MSHREDLMNALSRECKGIQLFLESNFGDDPQSLVERGNTLSGYLARTSKMLADAKQIYNVAKGKLVIELIDDIMEKKLSAKVQNSMVDSLCCEEKYLVDWIDRLNSTCTHQLDYIRSLISKAKEELKYTQDYDVRRGSGTPTR